MTVSGSYRACEAYDLTSSVRACQNSGATYPPSFTDVLTDPLEAFGSLDDWACNVH